jgi:1,4-alpha-glucan branching enzyme
MRAQRLFQIKIMSTAMLERGTAAPATRYSANRTRHHVNFFCDAPRAESVKLVGDFNGWDLAATPMRRMPDGRWMASLELHHGHHRYVFLVDGEPQLDPNATGIARDDHNERVSLTAVS